MKKLLFCILLLCIGCSSIKSGIITAKYIEKESKDYNKYNEYGKYIGITCLAKQHYILLISTKNNAECAVSINKLDFDKAKTGDTWTVSVEKSNE